MALPKSFDEIRSAVLRVLKDEPRHQAEAERALRAEEAAALLKERPELQRKLEAAGAEHNPKREAARQAVDDAQAALVAAFGRLAEAEAGFQNATAPLEQALRVNEQALRALRADEFSPFTRRLLATRDKLTECKRPDAREEFLDVAAAASVAVLSAEDLPAALEPLEERLRVLVPGALAA